MILLAAFMDLMDPLPRIGLLVVRSLSGGLVVRLRFLAAIIGFFLVFMQFLQLGLGYGALRAGLTLLPWSVIVAVVAGLSAAVLSPQPLPDDQRDVIALTAM